LLELSCNRYLCAVPTSFSKPVFYDKKMILATVVTEVRKDGPYYEVNIKGFPRFFMTWSALGRYDVVGDIKLPYDLVLAVSDMIEKTVK
jgi:hypothetical protein